MVEGVLTPMERECVRRLASGAGNAAIAAELGIGKPTLSTHLYRAALKLDVYCSRTELLMEALRCGELALEELVAPAHVLARG